MILIAYNKILYYNRFVKEKKKKKIVLNWEMMIKCFLQCILGGAILKMLLVVGCRCKANCPFVEPGPIGGVLSVEGLSKGS